RGPVARQDLRRRVQCPGLDAFLEVLPAGLPRWSVPAAVLVRGAAPPVAAGGRVVCEEAGDLLDVPARLLEGRDAPIAGDVPRSGVEARQGEAHVAVVAIEQLAQVFGAAEDVLARIERIRDAELLRQPRHELHEALGPGPRLGE